MSEKDFTEAVLKIRRERDEEYVRGLFEIMLDAARKKEARQEYRRLVEKETTSGARVGWVL